MGANVYGHLLEGLGAKKVVVPVAGRELLDRDFRNLVIPQHAFINLWHRLHYYAGAGTSGVTPSTVRAL
jgi:hypothetical protein